MRNKLLTATEAAALVRSGDTLVTSGFVGIGTPDAGSASRCACPRQ